MIFSLATWAACAASLAGVSEVGGMVMDRAMAAAAGVAEGYGFINQGAGVGVQALVASALDILLEKCSFSCFPNLNGRRTQRLEAKYVPKVL